MSKGLTEEEQTQYERACVEAEWHNLLLEAMRRSKSVFAERHTDRFQEFIQTLYKLETIHQREKQRLEQKRDASNN